MTTTTNDKITEALRLLQSQGVNFDSIINNQKTEEQARAEAEQKRADSIVYAKNTKQLVKVFFNDNNYTVSLGKINQGKKSILYSDVRSEFVIWCQDHDIAKKLSGEKNFDHAYALLQKSWYEEELDNLDTLLNEEPLDNDIWNKLQKQSGWRTEDIIVLKGWIHNVKRIILGKPSLQIPMPVLYADDQGIGKSFFTNELLKPLGCLSSLHDIDKIKDKFGQVLYSKLLVANFDEMAGFDRSDANYFKQWYTQTNSLSRVMQSQAFSDTEKKTQSIGSSNKPICQVFSDTTGSRRLWEIVCSLKLIDFCRNEDFLSLWQTVDTDLPNPYEMHRAKLERMAFDEQRNKSEVELFLIDYINGSTFKDEIKANSLFTKYAEWCSENKMQYTKNSMSFGLALKEGDMKLFVEKKRKSDGQYYIFTKNEIFDKFSGNEKDLEIDNKLDDDIFF
jgi:hypothetical protein